MRKEIFIGGGIELIAGAFFMLGLPTWSAWVVLISGILIVIYGISLGKRDSQKKEKELQMEIRQLRIAIRESFLAKIPSTLQDMHKQLQGVVVKKAKVSIDKNILKEMKPYLIENLGIEGILLKVRTPYLDKLQTCLIILKIRKKLGMTGRRTIERTLYNKRLIEFLLNLSEEMDKRGIGLSQEQEINAEYEVMSKQLDNLRTKVSSTKLDRAITTYLEYSYGINSLALLYLYIDPFNSGAFKLLPTKYRNRVSSVLLRKAFNQRMRYIFNEVIIHTENALIGEEPQ